MGFTQPVEDLKMPVGKGAIANAIEQSQQEPGSSGEDKGNKIEPSGSFPYPPHSVEKRQRGMKNHEEPVGYVQQGTFHEWHLSPIPLQYKIFL